MGRLAEILFLLASIIILSYGLDLSKLNIFSLASLIFLMGGALFEAIIRRSIKPQPSKKKKNVFSQALLYIHFMKRFQRIYGDLYNFKDYKELKTNIFVYFTVFIYILITYILFSYFGSISLLVYVIPAITNIISFFKNK